MSFCIVTDTSSNLSTEFVLKNDIKIVPFSYNINGKEEMCLNDKVFNSSKFYNDIRSGAMVTTSQIPPQRYIDYMSPIMSNNKDILFIGMSSGISGSFESAKIASKQLKIIYNNCKIYLIDTLCASLGEGLLVIKAIECRQKGMDVDSTVRLINNLKHRVYQIFTVDDLKYLRKTGRISNTSALLGSMLQIKPLLKGNEEGKIVSFSRVRGRKRAIEAMAAKYSSLVVNPEKQIIGIAHADCVEDAVKLENLIRQKSNPKEILTVCYEPVTGSHVGPGALALFFEGNEDVRYG